MFWKNAVFCLSSSSSSSVWASAFLPPPGPALELAQRMSWLGVTRFLYTDISRDGTLTEPNFDANAALVRNTGMAVLASGGVTSLEHIRLLGGTGVEGVILGRALYDGTITLPEALAAAAEAPGT